MLCVYACVCVRERVWPVCIVFTDVCILTTAVFLSVMMVVWARAQFVVFGLRCYNVFLSLCLFFVVLVFCSFL